MIIFFPGLSLPKIIFVSNVLGHYRDRQTDRLTNKRRLNVNLINKIIN